MALLRPPTRFMARSILTMAAGAAGTATTAGTAGEATVSEGIPEAAGWAAGVAAGMAAGMADDATRYGVMRCAP